jgi:hypothetical protein
MLARTKAGRYHCDLYIPWEASRFFAAGLPPFERSAASQARGLRMRHGRKGLNGRGHQGDSDACRPATPPGA